MVARRSEGWQVFRNYILVNLADVANTERGSREWINAEGTGLNQRFIDYALPLIEENQSSNRGRTAKICKT